jgi:ABC-type transporter Mla MlaB component
VSNSRTLRLEGTLDRERLSRDRPGTSGLHRVASIDLSAVDRIDVAGIGYVAELIALIERDGGERPSVEGQPRGLGELARAYRIKPDFSDFP